MKDFQTAVYMLSLLSVNYLRQNTLFLIHIVSKETIQNLAWRLPSRRLDFFVIFLAIWFSPLETNSSLLFFQPSPASPSRGAYTKLWTQSIYLSIPSMVVWTLFAFLPYRNHVHYHHGNFCILAERKPLTSLWQPRGLKCYAFSWTCDLFWPPVMS